MTLAFPNPARSFDEVRNAVRFFGHDGMFEIRFFVEAEALAEGRARAAGMSEAQCLSAFDAMRAPIYDAARKVYAKHRRNSNTLTASDFGRARG
ncbi:DUF1488 domain-containing protein [Shinella sp. PSBB067]|uniref:DUF1488 domain-containing protein n=1 Tax=unclassified Shinella TaxID=2643062 RepID=UPI000929151F|nr:MULTISPECIES: DUF1488 domain-containing protein [unclassified Shinella]OJU83012.1 MAG: hypothetical protein BGO06_07495 [Shinella sp. 65-6]QRI63898.1 DUF1488 domain-containing protein [Shinella sp. PSBB067]